MTPSEEQLPQNRIACCSCGCGTVGLWLDHICSASAPLNLPCIHLQLLTHFDDCSGIAQLPPDPLLLMTSISFTPSRVCLIVSVVIAASESFRVVGTPIVPRQGSVVSRGYNFPHCYIEFHIYMADLKWDPTPRQEADKGDDLVSEIGLKWDPTPRQEADKGDDLWEAWLVMVREVSEFMRETIRYAANSYLATRPLDQTFWQGPPNLAPSTPPAMCKWILFNNRVFNRNCFKPGIQQQPPYLVHGCDIMYKSRRLGMRLFSTTTLDWFPESVCATLPLSLNHDTTARTAERVSRSANRPIIGRSEEVTDSVGREPGENGKLLPPIRVMTRVPTDDWRKCQQ
ncbi:hypothetical protein J6590_048572 [Homalodisca vitripennis]|nr:hypothetical protein J6590_048572 [Homalodisca vitripennis]